MTKPETKEIKKIYEEEYERLNKKYSFDKPTLTIQHYTSGTLGSANQSGTKIMINSTGKNYRQTIIHELCHAINYIHFKKIKKDKNGEVIKKHGIPQIIPQGHNTQFWTLCYEFGLTEQDYGYGLTLAMKTAKNQHLKTEEAQNNGSIHEPIQ